MVCQQGNKPKLSRIHPHPPRWLGPTELIQGLTGGEARRNWKPPHGRWTVKWAVSSENSHGHPMTLQSPHQAPT